ncbi:hypothetical protein DsansV1_C32g0222681 [Dioscorea sansibarensis]
MASPSIRSMTRASISPLRAFISKTKSTAPAARPSSSLSPMVRRSHLLSRSPVELGCCSGSMIPLHSAVAAARLTSRLSTASRGCRDLLQGTLCRTYPGL